MREDAYRACQALNESRPDSAPWLAARDWTYHIEDTNRLAIKPPVFSATLVGANSGGKVDALTSDKDALSEIFAERRLRRREGGAQSRKQRR